MPTALSTWDRLTDLHRWYAELDAPDPRPHLVAYVGDRACVLIGLRPFAPGAYQGPLSRPWPSHCRWARIGSPSHCRAGRGPWTTPWSRSATTGTCASGC